MKRAGQTIRYVSRQTGFNLEKVLTWTALAATIYVGWQAWKVGSAVKNTLNNVGSAVGTGLYDYLHPGELGETIFITAYFPDGSRRAIPGSKVNSSGIFTNTGLWGTYSAYKDDGKKYRILADKKDRTKKYAVPV